ncbi:unnamed protein product, partial [Symbiodinium necroappetens]
MLRCTPPFRRLQLLARQGAWWQVLAELQEWPSRGCTPDVVALSVGITACARAAKWQDAIGLVSAMSKMGVRPNTVAYNSMLAACSTGQAWEMALGCLQHMTHLGLADVISLNSVLHGLAGGLQWLRALHLLQDAAAELSPSKLDAFTFNAAMNACRLQWVQSLALLQVMLQARLLPDVVTCSSLVSSCTSCSHWARALTVYYDILQVLPEGRYSLKLGPSGVVSAVSRNLMIQASTLCGQLNGKLPSAVAKFALGILVLTPLILLVPLAAIELLAYGLLLIVLAAAVSALTWWPPAPASTEKVKIMRAPGSLAGRLRSARAGGEHRRMAAVLREDSDELEAEELAEEVGSIVGAFVATRTDNELREEFNNLEEWYRQMGPEEGPFPVPYWEVVVRVLWRGYIYDYMNQRPRSIVDLGREDAGVVTYRNQATFVSAGLTFAEAFERTGRTFTITCTPTCGGPLLLLNRHTAPNMLIASAVCASSSMPMLVQAVRLLEKGPDGSVRPWPGVASLVRDGTMMADSPCHELAEMLNMRWSIVSQVNPHAVPLSLPLLLAGRLRRSSSAWASASMAAAEPLLRRHSGQQPGEDYFGDVPLLHGAEVFLPAEPSCTSCFTRLGRKAFWHQAL